MVWDSGVPGYKERPPDRRLPTPRVTQGQEVEWLVDMGAYTSLLSTREWRRVARGRSLTPARMRITCADGRPMEVRGKAEVEIDFGSCRRQAEVGVADIGHGGILGMDALKKWGASVDIGLGKVRLDP